MKCGCRQVDAVDSPHLAYLAFLILVVKVIKGAREVFSIEGSCCLCVGFLGETLWRPRLRLWTIHRVSQVVVVEGGGYLSLRRRFNL